MRCCLLLVCLLVRCFPVTGPSLMRLLVRLSLVCCWSVTGLLLVCHWSVTGLLLVCSGHGRWSGSLIVHPSCIARASLVRHSSACSSFCWSAARPSLAMAVALPVALPLLRLLVCLLARRFLVTRLSAGPSLLVRR